MIKVSVQSKNHPQEKTTPAPFIVRLCQKARVKRIDNAKGKALAMRAVIEAGRAVRTATLTSPSTTNGADIQAPTIRIARSVSCGRPTRFPGGDASASLKTNAMVGTMAPVAHKTSERTVITAPVIRLVPRQREASQANTA